MAVKNKETFSTSIIANIFDSNSLLCYVTDGNSVKHLTYGKEYEHTTMISRTHLRLLTMPNGQIPTVIVDRHYPNAMYAKAIMQKVAELAVANGLTLGIHSQYNSHQSGKDYFSDVRNEIIQNCKTVYLTHANPMLTVLSGQCGKGCSGCGYRTNGNGKYICSLCINKAQCKNTTLSADCSLCEQFVRHPTQQGVMYYDDQIGEYVQSNQYMQKIYGTIIGLEKNLLNTQKGVDKDV
jgi:hypothetical protein